mmetsp:Transcript_6675/g.8794  ORF Transcript_6675/g.8794 Transcript_6675/m.8794 type:complete len:549 (-) Transcript_6675:137-1783(-)
MIISRENIFQVVLMVTIYWGKMIAWDSRGLSFTKNARFSVKINKELSRKWPQNSQYHGAKKLCMMANPERLNAINDKKGGGLQFFDEATVYVKGGSGGTGAHTFYVGAGFQRGKANGGSGGRGGDVVLQCDNSLNTLQGLRGTATFQAERGKDGGNLLKNGANAEEVVVKVPPGTIVYDEKDETKKKYLGELQEEGERMVVARGGQGGVGNAAQKAARGQAQKGTPPQGGQKKKLKLELKVVADIGLVGVPNAGKSTLLSKTSNAKPKIANYPFTTLVPNLGVCDPLALGFQGKGMVLADIPGLLEGAHKGVGLGREFLRHVDRCRVIIHIVDGSSKDPVGDLVAINQELVLFNPNLAHKPQVVVLNKCDITEVRDKLESGLEDQLKEKMGHSRLLTISAATGENIKELMERTRKLLDKIEEKEIEAQLQQIESAQKEGDHISESTVTPDLPENIQIAQVTLNSWKVYDERFEHLVNSMDWGYYGTAERVVEMLIATGTMKKLLNQGACPGDRILIGSRGVEIPNSVPNSTSQSLIQEDENQKESLPQ